MPRKNNGLNLFDAISSISSSRRQTSIAVTSAGATSQRKVNVNTLHSNAARWNEVLTPKTFIVRKKRKKKISILKKKILLERLKLYVKLKIRDTVTCTAPLPLSPLTEASGESCTGSTACVLSMYNFVDDIDLEDKDEVGEVISDVKELLMPFGCLSHVAVMVCDVFCPTGSVERTALVEATFDSLASAQSARSVLDGAMIGGRAIDIELHDGENLDVERQCCHGTDENGAAVASDTHNIDSCPSQSNSSSSVLPNPPCPPHAIPQGDAGSCMSIVLMLEHIVTRDSMEDEDEVQEVLRDLREICSTYGPVSSVWIEQRMRSTRSDDDADDATIHHDKSVGNDYLAGATKPSLLPWALLQYSSLGLAAHAVSNLDGLMISGSKIEASLYDWAAYNQAVFSDDFFIGSIAIAGLIPPPSSAPSTPYSYPLHALRLKKFIRMDQIDDEDEERELLQDLQSLLSYEIPHIEISYRNCLFIRQLPSKESTETEIDNDADEDLDVIVIVPSIDDSLRAMHYLSDRLISGELLSMDILQLITCGPQCDGSTESPADGSRVALFSYSAFFCQLDILRANGHFASPLLRIVHLCDRRERAVVAVRNYFTDEDLHEEEEEKGGYCCFEDIAQMKSDLHALAVGTVQSSDCNKPRCEGILNSCRIYRGGGGGGGGAVREEGEYVAMVAFRSLPDAEEALLHLDGRVIGGVSISARLDVMNGRNDEVSEEASNGLASVPLPPIPPACTSTTPSERSQKGRIVSNKSCIASEAVVGVVYSTSLMDSGPVDDDDGVATSNCKAAAAAMSELQVGGKFQVAKTLPKQTFHESPKLAIPVADEATNAALKELLKLISTFQIRAKEKNPMMAKLKLRFVCGIKQCLNAVKSNKVRLLLIAPNTEESEVLDNKIESLMDEATSRDVPVCYCLSKRLLGKACQLSMKQSAVAVLDPDGAFEYFKAAIRFIRPNECDKY